MNIRAFLIVILKAPYYAVVGAVLGLMIAALVLLANFLVHLAAGIEQGTVSQAIHMTAKYLPLVMAAGGFIAGFMPNTNLGTAVFGSARWANRKELDKLTQQTGGLLIGRDSSTGKLLRYDGPAHLLTMAPTRTGKGVGTIIPNLLTACPVRDLHRPQGRECESHQASTPDVRPGSYSRSFGVTGLPSSAFNPLDTLDPDGLDVAEDASTLADALVFDEPGMTGEAHWNEEAKALISGLLLKIVAVESPGRRHLGTLREYLTVAPDTFAALLKRMQESDEAGGLIARAANRHLGKSDREAAGVLSAAQRHTHFLDSPRMTAILGRSDFRFADLKRNNVTVFLVLPPDRISAYSRWLRLLVTQSLLDMARDPAKPETPVLYLLDEFAALGHLAPVERAMGIMAGYGVQLWPILQDVHQLRATYGQRAGTFLSNAGVLQVFGVNDVETAELIGKVIGKTDAQYYTRSWSDGKTSSAEHISARDLINPDEIMRLPETSMILLRQGQRPAWITKLRYYADHEFKGAYDPA